MGEVPLVDQNIVGKEVMGKLYDRMTNAKAEQDIGAFNSCYHDIGNSSFTHLAA